MDDELKSVMLERACDQNNSIMVECLLLLGADANRAKEAASLICQVNIQGLTFVFFCYLTLPLYSSYLHPIILHYRIYQFIEQMLVICRSLDSENFRANRSLRCYYLIIHFIFLPSLLS